MPSPSYFIQTWDQCCHSEKMKTLDGPIQTPKKIQGRIYLKLSVIFDFFPEKCEFFPENPIFSPKCYPLPAKISDNLFLGIDSKFQIFLLFSPTTQHFSTKSMNNSLLFGKKTQEKHSFPQNCGKTPKKPSTFKKP